MGGAFQFKLGTTYTFGRFSIHGSYVNIEDVATGGTSDDDLEYNKIVGDLDLDGSGFFHGVGVSL